VPIFAPVITPKLTKPIGATTILTSGVFSKALSFDDLHAAFWPLLLAIPVILGAAIALLKKQER
jgi:hypothetical protein